MGREEGSGQEHRHSSKDKHRDAESSRDPSRHRKDNSSEKVLDKAAAGSSSKEGHHKHKSRSDHKEHRHLRSPRDVDHADRKRSRWEVESRDRPSSRHERDRNKDRDRDRDHSEKRLRDDRDRHKSEGQSERDPKRRRGDHRSGSRPREQSRGPGKSAGEEAPVVALNQQEQKDIDARVKRAAAWQQRQQDKLTDQAAAEKAEAEIAAKGGWNLEDEGGFDEDDDEPQPAVSGASQPGASSPPPDATAQGPVDMEEGGDEVDPLDAFMAGNDADMLQELKAAEVAEKAGTGGQQQMEVDEVDPLDAFMSGMAQGDDMKLDPSVKAEVGGGVKAEVGGGVKPEPTALATGPTAVKPQQVAAPANGKGPKNRKRMYDSDSSIDEDEGDSSDDDEDWAAKIKAGRLSKGERLGVTNHDEIEYPPFRRNFYIEVPELARMSDEEVNDYRKELNGIKCRGKNVPKPVKNWNQVGLSTRALDLLRKNGFDKPMPIQAQALPVIMSGRDCIGIAETGSGKTLAFVLPMLRHIKDQAPLQQGDGPVALVCAPTRELVNQIGKDIRKFAKTVNLLCVCIYGGQGMGTQISDLKRGTEIVVCTPGRMIDILVTGQGKITNLKRVTYLVFDEADRMFDMGFEPQISRLHRNIRPDRQTVMFSATFPRSVEVLARTALKDPVEVQVGGRSMVNKDITQRIEIRPEADRFLRLLEVLGEYYEKGKILIFVASQDQCDNLFRDLLKVGYPCLSLHGAKDQSDRESTINDFKTGVSQILVATSVAARGLDVKDLILVINYDCPNHHEDYVHRVGRTGRAGNKGTAITFISPEEEQYAADLIKALQQSGAEVPLDLKAMADHHAQEVREGKAKAHGSGYGGSGFKFNDQEEEAVKARRKEVARQHGTDYGGTEAEEPEDDDGRIMTADERPPDAGPRTSEELAAEQAAKEMLKTMTPDQRAAAERAQQVALRLLASGPQASSLQQPSMSMAMPSAPTNINPVVAAAQAAAMAVAQKAGMPIGYQPSAVGAARQALINQGLVAAPMQLHKPEENKAAYVAELEINDFPQQARFKVMHRETMAYINELTGANCITKGHFYDTTKGEAPGPGDERKIFLLIEGATPQQVKHAKTEIKKIIQEQSERAFRREQLPGGTAPGRYTL